MRRGGDIFRGDETIAELEARGMTSAAAAEIYAFGEFLRRAGEAPKLQAGNTVEVDAATFAYASGEISGAEYLERLAGRSSDLIGPERSEGPLLARCEQQQRVLPAHGKDTPANRGKNSDLGPSDRGDRGEKRDDDQRGGRS